MQSPAPSALSPNQHSVSPAGLSAQPIRLAGQGWRGAATRHRRRLPLLAALATAACLFLLLCLAPGAGMGAHLHLDMLLAGQAGGGGGYRSAAAAALLPALVRREDQLALERRWGVQPILEPQQGWGRPGMKIPRILHHGAPLLRARSTAWVLGGADARLAGANRPPTDRQRIRAAPALPPGCPHHSLLPLPTRCCSLLSGH